MNRLRALWAGGLLALSAAGAWAQSSGGAAESGLQLEEIVVTAQKVESNLQKTSISIQTYSGEELKKEGKKRIDEIMNGVVGVNVQTSQVGSSFYMRGVDAGGGGAPGGAPTQTSVAVLIDGVYQNRGEVVRGGTLDVAQVEVARGTQSTTLGASAIAGAVSLVSNQPVFEYQATGSLEVGNYHLLNMEGVMNVPLASDQALRFAYSSNKRIGYISAGAGDSDLTNVRLKYRWQPTEDLNFVVTGSHQNIGGNGVTDGVLLTTGHWVPWNNQFTLSQCAPAMGTTGGTTGYITAMGCPPIFVAVTDNTRFFQRSNPWNDGYPRDAWPNNPFRDTNIDSVSSDINWKLGVGTLTLTPSFQHATFKSAEVPRGTSWMDQDQVQATRQFEARLNSPSDSKISWYGGAYYYWTNVTGTFANVLFPGDMNCANTVAQGYCYTWTNAQQSIQETKSLYGNITYPVIDTLRLVGGVRYSHDMKNYIQSNPGVTYTGSYYGANNPYDYSCGITCSSRRTWSDVTYSAGVEYDVLPQSMVYAKYNTGYQPGALDSMTNGGLGSDKLTLEQITLGIKNRFFDNKLQANVEAFDTRYHDRAVAGGIASVETVTGYAATACPAPPGTAATFVTSVTDTQACLAYTGTATVPNVLSRGVDLEINFLPTTNDRLDLTVEYLDSKYLSVPSLGTTAYPTAASILANIANPTAGQINQANQVAALFANQVAAYKGLLLQNSPKWSTNAAYQHQFHFTGGSTLTPRVNAYFKSKYWSSGGGGATSILQTDLALENGKGHYDATGAVAPSIQPSYNLFDVFTTWESGDGKFTVTGYVKNIENEAVIQNANTTYVTLAPPRTYGLSFNASF